MEEPALMNQEGAIAVSARADSVAKHVKALLCCSPFLLISPPISLPFGIKLYLQSQQGNKENFCQCMSTCSTKASRKRAGCPCKTAGRFCGEFCSCSRRKLCCSYLDLLRFASSSLACVLNYLQRKADSTEIKVEHKICRTLILLPLLSSQFER